MSRPTESVAQIREGICGGEEEEGQVDVAPTNLICSHVSHPRKQTGVRRNVP